MSFVNNNSKTFIFQALNTVNDIREFLNSSCNDLSVAIECNSEIRRVALFIHDTDKSRFMLHTHDCFLKLSVNNNSVGHNNDIIENDLVISIMKRSKTVCKPSDRIGLAGACTMLDQIVE